LSGRWGPKNFEFGAPGGSFYDLFVANLYSILSKLLKTVGLLAVRLDLAGLRLQNPQGKRVFSTKI